MGFQLSAVASACSQTVMLFALAFDVAPNAVEAATASAAMSRAAATMRFLIENLQRASLDGLVRRDSPRWREERTCLRPSIGLYHSATARRLAHFAQGCQDHFRTRSSPSDL